MKEEQIRDEMRKIGQEVIALANKYRLPIIGLGLLSRTMKEELVDSMQFSRVTITLISNVRIRVNKSKLPDYRKQEVIKYLERLRNQHNELLRQLNI